MSSRITYTPLTVRVMARPADDLESLVRCLADAARSTNGTNVVLRLGTAGQWLADALAERGAEVRSIDGPWPSVQLVDRYGVVIAHPMGDDAPAIVHCAVQHATPGGFVVLCADRDEATVSELSGRFALEPIADLAFDGTRARIHRRTHRFTVHDLVFEARSQIR